LRLVTFPQAIRDELRTLPYCQIAPREKQTVRDCGDRWTSATSVCAKGHKEVFESWREQTQSIRTGLPDLFVKKWIGLRHRQDVEAVASRRAASPFERGRLQYRAPLDGRRPPSFDHFVGAQQECFRDRQTDCLCGLDVDNKI